jgi:hydrogenase nickel incorporation protein HypB
MLDLQTGETTTIAANHQHSSAAHHSHDHNEQHDHAHRHHQHHDSSQHQHHDSREYAADHRGHSQPSERSTSVDIIDVESRILAKNDQLAAKNRAWFAGREILALNLVSSPGAGKTTLLERTIRDLAGELPLYLI